MPATYSLVGIAYNTDLVKTPARQLGGPVEARVSRARSGSRAHPPISASRRSPSPPRRSAARRATSSRAGSKLQELEAKAARSPAALTQMLEREEIAIAPLWNNNTAAAAGKGLPVALRHAGAGAGRDHLILLGHRQIAPSRPRRGVAERHPQPRIPGAGRRGAVLLRADRAGRRGPGRCRTLYTHRRPKRCTALQTIDWTKIVPVRGQLVERFDRTFAF